MRIFHSMFLLWNRSYKFNFRIIHLVHCTKWTRWNNRERLILGLGKVTFWTDVFVAVVDLKSPKGIKLSYYIIAMHCKIALWARGASARREALEQSLSGCCFHGCSKQGLGTSSTNHVNVYMSIKRFYLRQCREFSLLFFSLFSRCNFHLSEDKAIARE